MPPPITDPYDTQTSPAIGSREIWFGGLKQPLFQKVTTSRTFPSDATHISVFMYVGADDPDTTNSSFFFSVDDYVLVHVDRPVFKSLSVPYYLNLDVDVRDFADGQKHKLSLAYYNELSSASAVILDYFRFIRDNSRLSPHALVTMFIS